MSTQAATLAAPVRWSRDAAVAAIWGLLAGLSAIAVLPYLLQLTPELAQKITMPMPVFAAIQGAQAFVLLGLLAFLGLRMGHRVGLGSPVLQGLLARRMPSWRGLQPGRAVLLGALVAVAVIALSLLLDPMLPEPLHPIADPGTGRSALNGLLASFYGGLAEELQLRLFLMTLLVWLATAFGRRRAHPAVFWIAIVVAALLFGAGHLPAAAKIWGLGDVVIVRTIVLNAVAGIVFGWLYWKRGIEMAMLGHFSADIVLHVLAPLAGGAMGGSVAP